MYPSGSSEAYQKREEAVITFSLTENLFQFILKCDNERLGCFFFIRLKQQKFSLLELSTPF